MARSLTHSKRQCRVRRGRPPLPPHPAPFSYGCAGASISSEDEAPAGLSVHPPTHPSRWAKGHQKRGDHRNDRSSTQRSQSNRLKCDCHVKITGQFIPHSSLFDLPKHATANLPFPTRLPQSFLRPRFSPRRSGTRSPLLPPRHVHHSRHQRAGSSPRGQRFSPL